MDMRIVRATAISFSLCIAGLCSATVAPGHANAGTIPAQARAAGEATAPIDINSASEEELRDLPGIGPARARAIVSGRPYSGKDDLVKRNIIPKNVYEGIRDRIVAKRQ